MKLISYKNSRFDISFNVKNLISVSIGTRPNKLYLFVGTESESRTYIVDVKDPAKEKKGIVQFCLGPKTFPEYIITPLEKCDDSR